MVPFGQGAAPHHLDRFVHHLHRRMHTEMLHGERVYIGLFIPGLGVRQATRSPGHRAIKQNSKRPRTLTYDYVTARRPGRAWRNWRAERCPVE